MPESSCVSPLPHCSVASTVAKELLGCRVAELPPCTGVDAHLNSYCIPTASAPCACGEQSMRGEWLSSYTPHRSLDRNSNFCANIKEERKRLAVMFKLWTEIQHKYHRKNDLSTAMLPIYRVGLPKADLSHLP